MIVRSFRLVAGSLIPQVARYKQAPVLVAAVILAGCGGSPQAKARIVAGPGYRFSAPGGWTVKRTRLAVTAMHGSDFVQVFSVPLVKTYTPALFGKVSRELEAQMQKLAGSDGRVEDGGDVTASGVRSHVYRLTTAGGTAEYTFVLVGRHEYQLLCRTNDTAVCRQLQTGFQLG
jgi:hypothetical protein